MLNIIKWSKAFFPLSFVQHLIVKSLINVLLILIVIRLSGVGSRGSSSSSGKLCALDILLCGNVCALYILYHIGYLNISYGDI